jgi:ABC-type cobalamin/Fe3+-siderophores transport system ATPase subunit
MPIEADSLNVSRLGRPVLREVSLRIEDGECVSIIGPNGAGKSTLMAVLLGLLPVESGTVRIDGSPIGSLHRRQIARRVSYVPQIHEGYMGFRVRDVIETGRYAYVDALAGLSPADEQAIVQAATDAHVEDLLDRAVDTLSGGERQKVWIATALAQATPALFLDEPTNALDPAHQAELIRLMRGLHAAGKTLLVICHDLNLPLALGGRVAALRDHGIAFDGPVNALRELSLLRHIYGTDFCLYRDPDRDAWSIQLAIDG